MPTISAIAIPLLILAAIIPWLGDRTDRLNRSGPDPGERMGGDNNIFGILARMWFGI